jgi:hypothetical protein
LGIVVEVVVLVEVVEVVVEVVLVVEVVVVVGDVTVRMNLEEDSPLSKKSPSPFLSMQE